MTGRTGGRCAGLKPGEGTCPDCGKIKYGSRKKAKAAARRMSMNGVSRVMRAYRCGDWWHLTSQSAERAAAWREYDSGAAS